MVEEEGTSRLMSNFEIGKDAVTLYIHPKIFPPSLVKSVSSSFEDTVWVTVDGDAEEEILVELKPKETRDLEGLAREFNNRLLAESTKDVKVDQKDEALVSRVKAVVQDFVKEERGRVSKQGIVAIGAVLTGMGFLGINLQEVAGSHYCGGDGGGSDGDQGGACFAEDELVTTSIGILALKDVRPGMTVTSYNHDADGLTISVVGEVIRHDGKQHAFADYGKNPLMRVSFKEGEKEFSCIVTSNHTYYDPESRRYRAIGDFAIGDSVRTETGEAIIMDRSILIDQNSPLEKQNTIVTNLHMSSGPPNYLVQGAVVHNHCFSANQKVMTPVGERPISEISEGEEVLSYDHLTDSYVTSTVQEVSRHDGVHDSYPEFIRTPLLRVTFDVAGSERSTEVTANHPYFDPVSRSYKAMKFFKEGDQVKMKDGQASIVKKEILLDGSTSPDSHQEVVYNLEMAARPHNYLVDGVLVHNGGGSSGGSSK